MNRKDIRHINLLALIAEYKTLTALAEAALTSEKYLWQVLHRIPLKSGNPRQIGDRLAEKIEIGCGKPPGWMDNDHRKQPMAASQALSTQEAELLRCFRAAGPANRRTLLAVARLIPPAAPN